MQFSSATFVQFTPATNIGRYERGAGKQDGRVSEIGNRVPHELHWIFIYIVLKETLSFGWILTRRQTLRKSRECHATHSMHVNQNTTESSEPCAIKLLVLTCSF